MSGGARLPLKHDKNTYQRKTALISQVEANKAPASLLAVHPVFALRSLDGCPVFHLSELSHSSMAATEHEGVKTKVSGSHIVSN